MRRKRRKAYKKWKMLTTARCASQPSGQVCQKIMKDLEKEVEGAASEAVFHQAGASGKSEGNGDEQTSVSINRKQNSSSLSEDEKQPPSDRKIHQKAKSNDPPSAVTQQPEKGLPVVMFNDYEKALAGNITMQGFPSTGEDFKATRGKFLAEVKFGAFTIQVDTRKSIFCKTGAQVATKKRCPTCHQQFSIQQIRRSATSRSYFPKYNNILAEDPKHKMSSTSTGETTRTENPSLNVHIVGKGIRVEYASEKQNISINIIHPKRRGKVIKHRGLSSSHAIEEPIGSPSQSHIRTRRCWSENKYQTSDILHDSSPVDAHRENLGTAISKKISPNIPPSASDNSMTGTVPLQDGSDCVMCSLFSPNPQLTREKAANIQDQGRNPRPAEDGDNANIRSVPASQSALRSSPSLSPSHWATTHLEPVETPANALSFNHCTKFELDQETVHTTDRNIDKVVLHSDSCANSQPLLERNSMQSPALGLAPCSNPLHSINHSSTEWDQTEDWETHAEIAVFNRTNVPFMASIPDEFQQRVITENDKGGDTVDSHCAMGVRNPEELPPPLEKVEDGKCQVIPVVKQKCHRDGEALTGGNHDEVCFGTDFPLHASESGCAGCAAETLLLIERTQTNDADLHHNHCETRLAAFQQEPAQCQKTASTRVHCEDEGQSDSKETTHPPEDVLLSPQMQKASKDQNFEINSLRKLSQDSSLRVGRASDGSQEEAVDQWARRRQQFKDRKRCSSAGGSSFASNVTEGSITSDDTGSMDLAFRVDIGEKGFYTENFHSAAWVFRGDDGNPEDSPRCLSKKPGPVAVRERTVRLFKGTGDYPWGFRIQFSKPIMVTEVDTNSAAEEAGLQIGDVVLSVNGTEVTSVEHAEAVHLARKGPDILTLVVGSDISRCPNTPWPTCRGYLHKRSQSGFLKGWRKRWFVLKYDGYLQYYKHKKDEGKCPPLEVIKLQAAEIDVDNSLGKPFVFHCVPQSGDRSFCLCATSNQEMKRWLEAMHRAAHPTHQNHVWEDVTLHNSSLPPLAIKNPECLGLLHQLERSTDTWVQHYCILKDGCLYFYASIRSTQASGGLYLQGYRVSEQTHNFKQSVIELKPPSEEFKTFYFCAENTTENQRWITALKLSIKKWLPLDQAIQEFMNRPLEETRM